MGFMDKLKSMKDAITGGAAKVQLEVMNPTQSTQFTVRVQAEIGEANLKIDKVYVYVEGVETTEMDVPVMEKDAKENTPAKTQRRSAQAKSYHTEVVLAGAQTLSASQRYTWEGTIQLPETALSTYKGINARHEWRLLAGLSAFGNDPDSGWVTVEIQ